MTRLPNGMLAGLVFLFLIFLIGPLAGCGAAPPSPGLDDAAAATTPPVPVRTARVAAADAAWTDAPGSIEAKNTATVASRLSAVIERVMVERGDTVRRGDILVRLDGRDITAQVNATEAAARAARAQRERIESLFAKEAATKQELEQATRQDQAAAAAVSAAKSQLDYVVLRAPFDGRVTDKMAGQGDLAAPGQRLLTIQGAGALQAVASVPGGVAEPLTLGQRVQVVLDDGSVVSSVISVLSPAADPVSRRFLVKCDLPPDSTARSGSFARVRLPAAASGEPLAMVPKGSLVERGALTGLFVVEQGHARLRWVSAGQPDGELVPVRAGIAVGEEFIIDPTGLTDGSAVAPAPANVVP
jgi:RND family efflux transporter MFP subunit